MAAPARAKLLTAMVLVLVFASGALVGMAFARGMSNDGEDEVADARSDDRDRDRDEDADDRPRRIYERVGLRTGQEERIDSILDHHRAALRALEAEFRDDYEQMRQLQKQYRDAYSPRYWAIVDSTRAAIKAVFDPDQAARYDSLLAEYDRRRRGERSDTSRD